MIRRDTADSFKRQSLNSDRIALGIDRVNCGERGKIYRQFPRVDRFLRSLRWGELGRLGYTLNRWQTVLREAGDGFGGGWRTAAEKMHSDFIPAKRNVASKRVFACITNDFFRAVSPLSGGPVAFGSATTQIAGEPVEQGISGQGISQRTGQAEENTHAERKA